MHRHHEQPRNTNVLCFMYFGKNFLKAAKNVLLSTPGIMTGLCLNSTGTCEIRGWCPVEDKKTPMWDPSLLQTFGNVPFCANIHSDPSHWPRYFTGLFITDKACQGPLSRFFFTQLSFLSHFQRAFTEQSWELHHLHQEFHQVSQVWILQVSGLKYFWFLLQGIGKQITQWA